MGTLGEMLLKHHHCTPSAELRWPNSQAYMAGGTDLIRVKAYAWPRRITPVVLSGWDSFVADSTTT